MSKENQSCLRFTLEESIWFQKGQEVGELYSLSLDPNVSIEEMEQYVIIRGTLDLVGEYKGEQQPGQLEIKDYTQSFLPKTVQRVVPLENGLQEFMHRFPVDITIPYNRINSLEEVKVSIQTFDYLLPENNCLKLSADLLITGIYGEQQHNLSVDEENSRADSVEFLQQDSMYLPEAELENEENAPLADALFAGNYRAEGTEPANLYGNFAEENLHQEALLRSDADEVSEEELLADVRNNQMLEAEDTQEIDNEEHRFNEEPYQSLFADTIKAASDVEQVRNEEEIWPAAELQSTVENYSKQDQKEEDGSDLFLPFEAVAKREPVQEESVETPQLQFSRGETTSQAAQHPAGEIQTKPGGEIEDEETTTPFLNIPQETAEVSVQQQAETQPLAEEQQKEPAAAAQPQAPMTEAPAAEAEVPETPVMLGPQITYGQEKASAEQPSSKGDASQGQQTDKKADFISLTDLFGNKEEELAKLKICIVQQGDSIGTLADRYDVSVQALLNSNNLDPSQDVKEGQVLYIPQLATNRR
ncbi:LysM peptidoglycan-binding domain-containing protein [Bacillus sp. M6-12]|uniref:LysM peptidoglycan-binding domain-containing protein n=1 Tax=Bacillus sp. M6-12 TaxID=2054166 RepID=UPI0015E0970B|nr:LysM peptidoglycan-binding domain-containing protein [Bacillus sp. M6-12]